MSDAGEITAEGRTPTQLAFRRFRKNRRAVFSAILLLLVGLSTLLVPFLSPHEYDAQHYEHVQEKPDAKLWEEAAFYCGWCDAMDLSEPAGKFWFGTDAIGRDLFVRSFSGGQISFAVGLLATAVSLFIGIGYGAVAAFAGGKVDLLMMRIVDILYGLPYMFVVIIAMAIFESRSFILVFLVLGAFGWLTMSRIVRGQILSLREREFVEAAKALGVKSRTIIWRHLIPNILGPVIVYTTLTVPSIMLTEAFLSFLGLGISEPDTSWGVLINEGANALNPIKVSWWLVAFPGALLAITLYCLNAVGDGLRDAFDVQQQ